MAWARVVAVGAMVSLTLGGCSASTRHGDTERPRTASTTIREHAARPAGTGASSTASPPPEALHRPRRVASEPGQRPQSDQLPSGRAPAFLAEMRMLWSAILTDRPGRGDSAFFPQAAYAQLKSIGDPAADWRYRLRADYRLDIVAAHGLLGTSPAFTQLVGVSVPTGFAHWIAPGVCENRVGYYEVPNSRIVYRERGALRSFGIASMISWRGRWYVIHLGYVGKLSIGGRVDDPSAGAGTSAATDTC